MLLRKKPAFGQFEIERLSGTCRFPGRVVFSCWSGLVGATKADLNPALVYRRDAEFGDICAVALKHKSGAAGQLHVEV